MFDDTVTVIRRRNTNLSALLAIVSLMALSFPTFGADNQPLPGKESTPATAFQAGVDMAEKVSRSMAPPAVPAASNDERVRPVPLDNEQSFPRSFKHEADKAELFKRYARTATKLATGWLSKDEVAFCRRFGEDLRAMRRIHFIEPIARGETEADPKLRAYWPNCANLQPDVEVWPPKGPGRRREYYRSKSAALYSVNIWNERPPVQRYVLFVQGVCTRDAGPVRCIHPGYAILDPDSCSLEDGSRGDDPYENLWNNKYGLSALVSYRGKIWSLSLEDDGGTQHIVLFGDSPLKTKHASCLFQMPIPDANSLPETNDGKGSDGK